MAQLTFNIPNGQLSQVVDALCEDGNFDPTDEEGEELKGQALQDAKVEFARQHIMAYIKGVVKQKETQKALKAANVQEPDIT